MVQAIVVLRCEHGNMNTATNRSIEQRQKALAHIRYEIEAMVDAWLKLNLLEDGPDRNVYVEATLLHARNLIEFVCRKTERNYIRAIDIIPGWRTSQHAALEMQYGPICEHLSHLTWTRLQAEARRPSRSLIRDVLKACRDFQLMLDHSSDLDCQAFRAAFNRVWSRSEQVFDSLL